LPPTTSTEWRSPTASAKATFNGNQIVAQLIGEPGIEFDARKLEWIGVPG